MESPKPIQDSKILHRLYDQITSVSFFYLKKLLLKNVPDHTRMPHKTNCKIPGRFPEEIL